ncbi:MAG: hypothetical protein IT348_03665 [Candidatus Eisenbacteria bacterium]|nr:hypothetical protein [Candidatus Eisenbacteria bacterium]
MDVLGQFHPQIVHTPVALLIFSALFAIAGRLFDREWVRKASVLLLVFGFLGAFAAVRSGDAAHHVPEDEQGVSEEEIDEHGQMGERTLYLAGGALVAVIAASRLTGQAAAAVGGLALVLQILAAMAVGFTGRAGGELVYEYGANVRVGGQLVKHPGAGGGLPGGAAADTLGAAFAEHEEHGEHEKHEGH